MRVYGLKKDQQDVLDAIQKLGVVEMSGVGSSVGEDLSSFFCSSDGADLKKSVDVIDDSIRVVNEAIDSILLQLDPKEQKKYSEVSPFKGLINISEKNFGILSRKAEKTLQIAYTIIKEAKLLKEKEETVLKLKTTKEELKCWKELDIPTNTSGTSKTTCFFGTLPSSYSSVENILKALPDNLGSCKDYLYIEILKATEDLTYVFVLCRREDLDIFLKEFLNLGFTACKYSDYTVPADEIDYINIKIRRIERELQGLRKSIKNRRFYIRDLKFCYDYYLSKKEKYEVMSKAENTAKTFVLFGYVPRKKVQKVGFELKKFKNVFLEVQNIGKKEDAPVILENKKVCAAVEPVLESYSLPSRHESDPTSVMSIFYYFLFGLMLSDAGYGAIMSLVCGGLLLKFKNMKSSLKKSLTMFFICGISTLFWGLMFGSFFGDAIEVVSGTFFGHKIPTPTLWFIPIKKPMLMLSFSFGVGIVHMFTGLFLKLLQLLRLKKYKEALFDVVSWFLLVGGLVVFLLTVPIVPKLLSLDLTLPSFVANIAKFSMLLGALTILFTSGRGSGNFFKRLLKGMYGLYGVTNYLSDIISYSRLLALGLSTGVIAQVFNKMGAMGGNGFFGVILFLLVFFVGHTVNILINLLGAYVHTNRLQFVEFFSKFYEGGGRRFSPFKFKTKYYNFFGGAS